MPFSSKSCQSGPPPKHKWSDLETKALEVEIQGLLKLGAIQIIMMTDDQFVSTFFIAPEPDVLNRSIMNFKKLNEFIIVDYFEMEYMNTVYRLLTPKFLMGSIDLRDGYFFNCRKQLRFVLQGKTYELTCLPFGLHSALFVFTGISKPVIITLREKGYSSVIYFDNFLCMDLGEKSCLKNEKATSGFLTTLGFIVNWEKRNLKPSTGCKYLEFVINIQRFSLELTDQKRKFLIDHVNILREKWF